MTAQEQDLFPPPAPPSDDQRDLINLLSFLRMRADWVRAKEISVLKGWDERRIRDLANLSKGEIISGQRGYLYTRSATKEEFDHFQNWMLSQAKQMIRRTIDAKKIFYAPSQKPPA